MVVSTILKNLFTSWRFFDFPNHEIITWVRANEAETWQKLSDKYKKEKFALFKNSNRVLFHWLNTQIEKMAFYNIDCKSEISSAVLFLYKSSNINIKYCFYKIEVLKNDDRTLLFSLEGPK